MIQIDPVIIAVDDEPGVLAFVTTVLRQLGFTVLTADNGRGAMRILREHQTGKVAMVLLDINMPRMDGPKTLAAMREVDPGLKCCFMSGGSIRYTPDELWAMGVEGVLLKPFRADALAKITTAAMGTLTC